MSQSALLEFEWKLPPGVRAAFTTRVGGVSAAPWDSFNLGAHVSDDPENVAANRARLKAMLALPAEPAWLSQVHGVDVFDLDARRRPDAARPPMLSVTRRRRPGLRDHGGGLSARVVRQPRWRSASAPRMPAGAGSRPACSSAPSPRSVCRRRSSRVVGARDSREHFEVGDEVCEAFVAQDAGATAAFSRNDRGSLAGGSGRTCASATERARGNRRGGGGWCTFADRERFFSHRREGKGGRMAALIWRE